jgi:Domain of unknown function (DUF4406)
MKLYLAGPMEGYKAFNFPAFDKAAEQLRGLGHEVFNPSAANRRSHPDIDWYSLDGTSEELTKLKFVVGDALCDDITYICREADAIALLEGWEKSKGARAESAVAVALNKDRYIQVSNKWYRIKANGAWSGEQLEKGYVSGLLMRRVPA